jgi:hypothetical protein
MRIVNFELIITQYSYYTGSKLKTWVWQLPTLHTYNVNLFTAWAALKSGANPTYDRELQRQCCKNLQRN